MDRYELAERDIGAKPMLAAQKTTGAQQPRIRRDVPRREGGMQSPGAGGVPA